jgi:peptidyl-prolyl cis-trans isomerase C
MRFPTSAALAVLLASTVSLAQAQTPAGPSTPAAAPAQEQIKPDTVLATVNGEKITERDLAIAYSNLPDSAKQQPQAQVLPQLLNELINEKAIDLAAIRDGLENNPDVRAGMDYAADQVLQTALLRQDIGPQLTEDKIKAAYDAQYAGKPGETEIHAEHILVKTQAEAQAIIDQLNKGADFSALAKAKSTDPNATDGGDLGWFKRGDMVQSFSDAAFALKPGQYSQTPVQSPYGWHVIKVLGTRVAPPQTYEEVHDTLAQSMEQAAVRAELTKLRSSVKVVVFDQNGKPVPQTSPGTP